MADWQLSLEPLLRRLPVAWRRLAAVPAGVPVAADADDVEAPLRDALFSSDQMVAHGRRLAGEHVLSRQHRPDGLLRRLADNERVFRTIVPELAPRTPDDRPSPAAEWLLDNLYLIEEEVRTARRHLPAGYSRELPRLADPSSGSSIGLEGHGLHDVHQRPAPGREHALAGALPRVYVLALEAVAHADGRLSRGALSRFVASYQAVQPLMLGELWAFPIMLRLALLENLRRVAINVKRGAGEREVAAQWAARMLMANEERPSDLILEIADMARSDPPLGSAFVAEFARRLQGQGKPLALPLSWIEQRLGDEGGTIEHLVQAESQQQAANQVSVANSIGSLRLLGATDWPEFVEALSLVEQTLRDDPGGVYGRMDFGTRDAYRHAIERVARKSGREEVAIARLAVDLAAAAAARAQAAPPVVPAADDRDAHVGHYLVGSGRGVLALACGLHAKHVDDDRVAPGVEAYVAAIWMGALLLSAGPLVRSARDLEMPTWALPLVALPLLIATSQLSQALVHWVLTLFMAPRPLPRMDPDNGIGDDHRTLVAVPVLLGSAAEIESLVDALEVRFLANRDPALRFALLTDFRDAKTERVDGDDALVAAAIERIRALNERYREAGRIDPFLLLHRPRLHDAADDLWLGRERKRGKLEDLNALLRGRARVGPGEAFSVSEGALTDLERVRFVITLDADTYLPRDAAVRMVAAMIHPLNRPRFATGEREGIVVEGYGMLQPRVSPSLPSSTRSRYARLFAGDVGIDPYTRAVSDVYQDLFGEGSFIGKGIYDVDAFTRALHGRLPDRRVLSHDLLEGCHARCGLLSDVELYEDAPPRYGIDVARRHRWIRGDWQIAGWVRERLHMLPGAPRNPLSPLSRWKLFDNLRRSLVGPSLLVLLVLGWVLLPQPARWTLRMLAVLGLVPLAAQALEWLRRPLEALRTSRVFKPELPTGQQLLQLVQAVAGLPFEVLSTLDAIARTAWRVNVSHRRLLQWTASADLRERHPAGSIADLRDTARRFWAGPAFALVLIAALVAWRPNALGAALPVLLLWLGSPVLFWWIDSAPSQAATGAQALGASDRRFLRRLARRTWNFFESHVTAEDNHLPPDNVQLEPVPRVAHRTSPTNIGFALLANVVAHELGWITGGQVVERVAATLATTAKLERHRGHLLNWYDTQTLLPLLPRYVSTVDSGNFAGQLLVLREALVALPDEPLLSPAWFDGVQDTLGLVGESLQKGIGAALMRALDATLVEVRAHPPATLAGWRSMLERLDTDATALHAAVTEFASAGPVMDTDTMVHADAEERARLGDEAAHWADALVAQCRAGLDELALLVPLSEDAIASGDPAASRAAPLGPEAPLPTLRALAALGVPRAIERVRAIDDLCARIVPLEAMDLDFLFDEWRHLMSIGFNVDESRLDPGAYDLLASEARLGLFVAIARGQLPQQAWFALGRLLTQAGGDAVLMSWSGSMFEYLMPRLLMPGYPGTLLEQTCRGAVRRHIEYGRSRGVPWGISESGYNATDAHLNYQYRAFGVPGLGLKRGLGEDLVVAPYASEMALTMDPVAAVENLRRLTLAGASGRWGLFEAIDYTPSRVPRGQRGAVVRSFMAHHQGMGLAAMEHVLGRGRLVEHFTTDPSVKATLLLLQERVPKGIVPSTLPEEEVARRPVAAPPATPMRVFAHPDTPAPEVQLLSNGRWHTMVTQAGGGWSRWKDLAITRWREDTTCDGWGTFCYLRDVDSGEVWSNAWQPTRRAADDYQAIFSEGRAEFRRRDSGIDLHTEIAVSPEDDIELRRLRIKNTTRRTRTIELTSYAEIVLQSPAADAQHPAFGKLFLQTELVPALAALLCHRRPRGEGDSTPWVFHVMAVHLPRGAGSYGEVTHETDRARFIGRGGQLDAPHAMREAGPLSNTMGSVLDPILSSRVTITIPADQTVIVDLVIGVADQRAGCVSLVEKYRDRRLADRVFELAWTHSQVLLRQLNATEGEAQAYARLAGSIVYSQRTLRADPALIRQNRRGQSSLWGYAISGDLPIVLVQVSDVAHLDLVKQAVTAHAWWRLKGLAVDLVIWNEERDIYRQRLQEQVMGLVAAGVEAHAIDRPGGVFIRHADQIPHEDRTLLLAVARAVLNDRRGTFLEQLERRPRTERRNATRSSTRLGIDRRRRPFVATRPWRPEPSLPRARPELDLYNGIGGFAPGGREYVIAPANVTGTPAPWANVMANPLFGTVVTEVGGAYTWCENAHEFRLTPWLNDPVSDPSGEAFFLRDEETGLVWSPTGTPGVGGVRANGRCVVRHGFGATMFEQQVDGLLTRLTVYVDVSDPVKWSVLEVVNESGRARRVSVTGYVEWVLGVNRAVTAPHVTTERAPSGALQARNAYGAEFGERVAFFDVDEGFHRGAGFTCDRTEFIGRNGTLRDPRALRMKGLVGATGAALDPCAALQVVLDLADGQTREVAFRLGVGRNTEDTEQIVARGRLADAAANARESVRAQWDRMLGAVQVRTPDPSLDVLANGWLLYQVIACRLWARSGFYQSGGAFGYRDQLQDAMALVHARPEALRDQIMLCATRQFEEGDVQHWWHPPHGRGVRTRISDDYLWLPLALARYVDATGDESVLDESEPFLHGRPVDPHAESYYDLPGVSGERANVYEHALRALRHGLRTGEHGLPLMGCGDWNDGMNRVGDEGRGESVWLGFFLCEVLKRFAVLARRRGDEAVRAECDEARERVALALETSGWDGAWYRRAYFDDGQVLGSAANAECRIDSISQSWAVLSGVAPHDRATAAMEAVDEYLVDRKAGIVRLLEPPFDGHGPNPGYISGYVPGVRENGGQYTHSAIWAAMAFAQAGDAARAWEVLDMINPVNHARDLADVQVYKVEPYVMTADVYGVAPHTGRGGWSWYTGSAGWMYRLVTESVLGLHVERLGSSAWLRLDPVMPPHWPGFEMALRFGSSTWHVRVTRGTQAIAALTVDGAATLAARIPLTDDGTDHQVVLALALSA
jgi:cellobiose phosphorylase